MVRFRLAGIPIAVQPWFWVLALFLGIGLTSDDGLAAAAPALAVWVAIVFGSVLFHELGHAFALRAFGYRPAVLLHMIGGLTSWQPEEELPPARRVASTLAGPLAGFALAGLAWLVRSQLDAAARGGLLWDALTWLLAVNVVWGIFNLVPIRGLDGGQAVGGFLEILFPRQGRMLAEVVYVVTGGAAVVFGIWQGYYLLAIFAAVLTFGGMFAARPGAAPARRPAPAPDAEPPKLGI